MLVCYIKMMHIYYGHLICWDLSNMCAPSAPILIYTYIYIYIYILYIYYILTIYIYIYVLIMVWYSPLTDSTTTEFRSGGLTD